MSRERAARLAHDVGKYIARIARNAPPSGPWPAPLSPLLVKDLYALPGDQRASERFEELAPQDEKLAPVRAALARIDTLEAGVRAGNVAACREACALALEVEASLRRYAEEAR